MKGNRWGLSLFLVASATCHAGRPMVTDDAHLLDAKACQLETWGRGNPDSTELWFLPACNPMGGAEIAFGGATTRENGSRSLTDEVFQVKTLFRDWAPDGWGIGLAGGIVRHPHRERATGWDDWYLNLPFTVALRGESWLLHVNAGASHRQDVPETIAIWGLASEVNVRPELGLIAEAFRNERGRPFYQLAVRYGLNEHVQIDGSYGDRIGTAGGAERWFTIGLKLQTAPFLP